MELPEKKYYSLDKAIKKINKGLSIEDHIDLDDLFHFFYNEQLEFCVHIYIKNSAKMLFQRKTKVDDENYEYFTKWLESPCFLPLTTEYSDLNFFDSYSDQFETGVSDGQGATLISVLPYFFEYKPYKKIDSICLPDTVFLPRNCSYNINKKSVDNLFYTPKLKLTENYSISIEDLVITNREIELFKNGGEKIQNNKEAEKTVEKAIRIQNPERILNQIFMKEHFKELWENSSSTTLANKLNYLAHKHGFDEKTISGWINRYNS